MTPKPRHPRPERPTPPPRPRPPGPRELDVARIPHHEARALILGLRGEYEPNAPAPVTLQEAAAIARRQRAPLTMRELWQTGNWRAAERGPLGLNHKGISENLLMLAAAAAAVCEHNPAAFSWLSRHCAAQLDPKSGIGWMGTEGGTSHYVAYGLASVRAALAAWRQSTGDEDPSMAAWVQRGLSFLYEFRLPWAEREKGASGPLAQGVTVAPIGARIQQHFPNDTTPVFARSEGLPVERRCRVQPGHWPYAAYELAEELDRQTITEGGRGSLPPMRTPFHTFGLPNGGLAGYVETNTVGHGSSPVLAFRAEGPGRIQRIDPWPHRARVQARVTLEGADAVARGRWAPPDRDEWTAFEERLRVLP